MPNVMLVEPSHIETPVKFAHRGKCEFVTCKGSEEDE